MPAINKNIYKLTAEETVTLKELEKIQPDANWTAEKYYKLNK